MKIIWKCSALLMLSVASVLAHEPAGSSETFPDVQSYLEQRIKEFDQIPLERQQTLKRLSSYIKARVANGQPVRLTFICTHNSRRSHLSQVWAAAAADFYHVPSVESFSGGTEATAFNPRAIAAIERVGLRVEKIEDGKNPRYAVRYRTTTKPLICFSKVYNDAFNPKDEFCAVMTCTQADKGCPRVEGCALRVAIPFEDPKVADGTADEASTYDERCRQICREMLFVFSQAKE